MTQPTPPHRRVLGIETEYGLAFDGTEPFTRGSGAEALFRMGGSGLKVLRQAASSDHNLAAEMAGGLLEEKGLAA